MIGDVFAPPLFDTHAHLDDPQLLDHLPAVLSRAKAIGVTYLLAISTTPVSAAKCVQLAEQHPQVWASVGVQPNHVHESSLRDWGQIVSLSQRPKVRAIGETGLDHFWDFAPLDQQRKWFDLHLELAMSTGLPLVIHMREPNDDAEAAVCGPAILDQIKAATSHRPVTGVMHSFSGSAAIAAEAIELGLYISFSGMITYKKSEALRQVAKGIPEERLLIETDSPYLSPHPHRGRRPNEPELLCHTARQLAEIRKMEYAELCQLTTENALRLFTP